MSERQEFVVFARQEGATISALCERYGISRKTGYKWLRRAANGDQALADRSRRPRSSPTQTRPDLEARILELRTAHPSWGGRKLHHRLVTTGMVDVPAHHHDQARRDRDTGAGTQVVRVDGLPGCG